MAVVHLSESNFEKALEDNKVIIVDFWATWCGPCRMIAPVLEEIANDYSGKVTVAKVDVDENPELARKYGVMSIPNVVIIKNGQEVGRKIGAMPKSAYTSAIDAVLA